MSDLKEQLLPCPFCGGTELHTETMSVQPDVFHDAHVECATCEARGRRALTVDGWLASKDEARVEAIAAWNRRAPAAAPAPVAASDDQPGAHHLTPENIEAIADDLEAVARGEAAVPAVDRDWITRSAILAKVIRHLTALAAAPAAAPVVQPVADTDHWLRYYADRITHEADQHSDEFADIMRAIASEMTAAPTPASSTAAAKDAGALAIACVINNKLGKYIAANKQVLALLGADELAALRRFNETCEDDEEYDVPKEMMRRLAAIGAIEWKGFSRYQITNFGDFVLDRAAIASSAGEVKP